MTTPIGTSLRLALLLSALSCGPLQGRLAAATVTGEIIDSRTKRSIPGRLYIQNANGRWFFPTSTSAEGSAVRYQRQNGMNKNAVEQHTTLSAHPFQIDLDPGSYTFTVERGKEYRPLTRRLEVAGEPVQLALAVERWVDMSLRGWFSGDTHVHRDPAELPNVMLAEDVNVVFPMVYWTTTDRVAPSQSDKNVKGEFEARPFEVDSTHVYYPRNTEYEIFNSGGRSHTLGALAVLRHQTVLDLPVLPLRRVAERARAEGALLDLEKHNWPWSMVLVPLVHPDFFELANNHHWRTDFSITNWAVPAPAWMQIGNGIDTEDHWTLYGFQNYYALLDCGFRLRPGAGTANGVHPVPLGFGRVYVHLDGPFSFDRWLKAWNDGRSFVTTGPMLMAQVDGELPGHRFVDDRRGSRRVKVAGTVLGEQAVSRVEVVVNGSVAKTLTPRSEKNGEGAWEATFTSTFEIDGSAWVAIRCWENRSGGRSRFAHSAPTFFDRSGSPLRPRKEEVEFLVERVRSEIERSAPILPVETLAEYREALQAYEALRPLAR